MITVENVWNASRIVICMDKGACANPCAAELFDSIFHSFEAGIALNDEKMYIYEI